MKKLLLSTIVLVIFAVSIGLFQISCQKDAAAQTIQNYILPPATTSKLGGIIVGSGLTVTSNGTLSSTQASMSPATSTAIGGIIVGSGLSVAANGTLSANAPTSTQKNKIIFIKRVNNVQEIWTANYDGSNQSKITLSLPTGLIPNAISVSPDGQTLLFDAWNSSGVGSIYTCKVDGTNLTKIVDGTNLGMEGLRFLVAY